MGGGTGLSTLLRGLKAFASVSPAAAPGGEGTHSVSDLAAVVTVTDDGGSSGRLRKDLKMLPPGDIRNCLVALSENEAVLSRLFQYRFESGEWLEGHSFGNLFLAALSSLTGDFAHAVRESCRILATRGNIYPSTNANVTLRARMDDGSEVLGETNITASHKRIVRLCLEPEQVDPLPDTLDAIGRADLITVGPGSLYTSLIPNLLVRGVTDAIGGSGAVRVFVCNLMTQANESLGLSASEHIEKIYEHAGREIFDYALLNTSPVSSSVRERYAAEGAEPIAADAQRVEALGVTAICGPFAHEGNVLRHNYDLVADTLLSLGARGRTAADAAR